MQANENLSPPVAAQLLKQIKDVLKDPLEDISVIVDDENITEILADIQGPTGTPFEGGLFRIQLHFGADYPRSPPKGYFLTKIFHPNVAPQNGEICVNTLKKDWKPDLGIRHILSVIRCLLIVPNPDSALNEEAGKLLNEGYESFAKRAAMFTKIHAQPSDAQKAAAAESKTDAQSAAKDPLNPAPGPDKSAASSAPAAADKPVEKKEKKKATSALRRL